MLKAVIFDMDGVIIDSEPFHLEVNKELFSELGIKFSDREYARYIGVSNNDMFRELKRKYNLRHPVKKMSGMQMKGFLSYIEKNPNKEKPVPGVIPLLKNLKKNRIKIALASSSNMKIIKTVLKMFKITNYFGAIVSGEKLNKSKPAPEIFIKTAKRLNIKPENCVVIEDATHGITAAKAAGMKCVGLKNPNSGSQNLSKADMVVNSIEKLNSNVLKQLYFEKSV